MRSYFFCRKSDSLSFNEDFSQDSTSSEYMSASEGFSDSPVDDHHNVPSTSEASPLSIITGDRLHIHNRCSCCVLLKNVLELATRGGECCICGGESISPVFQFDCPAKHHCCIPCFQRYAEGELLDRKFKLHDTLGYTTGCPSGCEDYWITDPHHYYLLGKELYAKYKHMATEAVLVAVGGNYCPNPSCGTAFTFEPSNGSGIDTLLCPECKIAVCLACRMRKSNCICAVSHTGSASGMSHKLQEEFQSIQLVRSNSRPCPKCRSPTEKTGGCNHMNCVQCGNQWCWLCVKEWTNDCQFTHWLESQ